MPSKLILFCLLTIPLTGCTIYRQASRPELWGLGPTEMWDYDSMRESGMSHAEARRILRERRAEASEAQDSAL